MSASPFAIGSLVTWSNTVPEAWCRIWTPGPMTVVSAYWHDGIPNEYAKMFGEGGMRITPGWILTVEYDPDASGYYNPPLSLLLGKKKITKDVHEKWLVLAPQT